MDMSNVALICLLIFVFLIIGSIIENRLLAQDMCEYKGFDTGVFKYKFDTGVFKYNQLSNDTNDNSVGSSRYLVCKNKKQIKYVQNEYIESFKIHD